MLDLYHQVTSGPICEYEEGAIMMLVLRNPANPEEDHTLSCSKIKTVEYKVFKKIKDKLKNYWETYEKVTYISKKMEKEYKTKFDRFKIEVNDIFKTHLPIEAKTKKSKQNNDLVSKKISNFHKLKSVIFLNSDRFHLLQISITDVILLRNNY